MAQDRGNERVVINLVDLEEYQLQALIITLRKQEWGDENQEAITHIQKYLTEWYPTL